MGVLPLQFKQGDTAASLGLTGAESYDIDITGIKPRSVVPLTVRGAAAQAREIEVIVRIDTPEELTAFRHGGILPYVLRQLVERAN
jgi:aconitate hydratase